jgi:hypothetical protein
MIRFTFIKSGQVVFSAVIVIGSDGGAAAQEEAVADYRAYVDPDWCPGKDDLVIDRRPA